MKFETSLDKSEILSRRLASEAIVFTIKHVQHGIGQSDLGRPGCRPITPAESRPRYTDAVGSYFHTLDGACSTPRIDGDVMSMCKSI